MKRDGDLFDRFTATTVSGYFYPSRLTLEYQHDVDKVKWVANGLSVTDDGRLVLGGFDESRAIGFVFVANSRFGKKFTLDLHLNSDWTTAVEQQPLQRFKCKKKKRKKKPLSLSHVCNQVSQARVPSRK
jgi:hypothetical protein